MKFDPQIHHRRSIRLKGYDYSREGAYFITIVTQERECLFGRIFDEEMKLNTAGEAAVVWWQKLAEKYPSISLGEFVLMPNHLHGVIVIESKDDIENKGQTHGSAPTDTHEIVGADPRVRPNAPISQMVQWFKTMTTNEYIRGVKELEWAPFMGKLWQRNYGACPERSEGSMLFAILMIMSEFAITFIPTHRAGRRMTKTRPRSGPYEIT